MGFWKNHLTLAGTFLPLKLGNYTVDTTAKAFAVFSAANCGSSKPSDAAGCLAGQLLATELNIANGANPNVVCNTININDAVTQANALLAAVGYNGPNLTYTLTSAQRKTAISLANALAAYNAGTC